MKRLFTFALAAVAASGILFAADARLADEDGDGLKDRRPRLHRLNLTDEQRREIRDTVTKLRDSGASRTEIVIAVGDKLQGLGVELPEDFEARQAEKVQRANSATSCGPNYTSCATAAPPRMIFAPRSKRSGRPTVSRAVPARAGTARA